MSYSNLVRGMAAQPFNTLVVGSNLNGLPDDGQTYFCGILGPTNAAGGQAFNFGTLGYTGNRPVEMSIIPLPGESQLGAGHVLDGMGNMLPYIPKIYYRVMGGTTIRYTGNFLAANTQTYRFGMSIDTGLEIQGIGFIVIRFVDQGVEIARIPYSFASY